MATISLDQFIDKYAEVIDSGNTYDLLFYANMNLDDEDLSIFTKELAKLGLNLLEHLKKDYDEVRLFDDDFTLEDLQKYLTENYKINVTANEYYTYNLADMFELLEEKKYDLGIDFASTNMEPFEYTDEYLDTIRISVHVQEDAHFMSVMFITRTGLVYEITQDLEHDSFSLNGAVGYALNKNMLKDEIAGMDHALRSLFKAYFKR